MIIEIEKQQQRKVAEQTSKQHSTIISALVAASRFLPRVLALASPSDAL